MRVILASNNQGKLKEIKHNLSHIEIIPYFELMETFEVVEDAPTFVGNATKKAKEIYEKLADKMEEGDYILSDDSGICVDALDGEPGIHSARYAHKCSGSVVEGNSEDKANLQMLISNLAKKQVQTSKAHYVAILVLCDYRGNCEVFEGQMHGEVTTSARGENGFGYDPIFVPEGYDITLAQMDFAVKQSISHRGVAIEKLKKYFVV